MPFSPCASSFSRLQLSGARLSIALLASTALVAQPLAGGAAFAGDALPTGGQVVSGSVSIGASGPAMTVTQGSDKAIVNWNGFSVGQGNSVNFIQPNSTSAILNRVTGSTTSTIAGSITGNGQVYLINPNGIAITSTGSVAVGGGFVASTLDMSNEDFLKGQYNFTGNGSSGSVTNEGVITVGRGGYAALIGGTVKNDGLIAVPLGKVGLGSGEQATLDLSGDGFLQVAIPTKTSAEGNGALVENSGTISANGGTVVMKAATARNAARHAVNLSGSVEADSISGSDGEIVIGGGEGGHITVSGKLSAKSSTGKGGKVTVSGKSIALKGATVDASGAKGGGTVKVAAATGENGGSVVIADASTIDAKATATGSGGTVLVTGNNIAVQSGSLIDATGATGGLVLIGGDYQGGYNAATKYSIEDIATAQNTTVEAGSTILVDGKAGAGGRAVIWSDGTTSFSGTISATAAGSAEGGKVETSGHNLLLGDSVAISTLSERGATGVWLIDPYNINISSSASSNASVDVGSNPWTISPTASGANINNTTLSSYLASSNVALMTNGAGSEAGNITVNAAVSWSAATTLSLLADTTTGGVFINAPITGSNANSGLIISAGSGGISQTSTIQVGTLRATTASGGSVTLTNSGNLVSTLGTSSATGSFAFTNGQALTISGGITSNGNLLLGTTSGDLILNGVLSGSHANSSLVLSSAGNLNITKDVTWSGANAAASLTYGGSYSLTNGARVSLPDTGASLTINGTSYTLIHDVTGLQSMSGSGNYALGNDIDASVTASWNSGAGFAPVGVYGAGFSGTFAGLGHFIDGLTVKRPNTSQVGLFGYTTSATVRDLTLSNVSINGSSRVGGLVGWADNSNFSNIHVTGTIGAYQEAGGIAGWFVDSTLSNASSAASVTVSANGAGGLVGYALYSGTISNSYATGSVTGATYVGGLVGQTFSITPLTLTNVYASGRVTGTSAGGLIGFDDPDYPSAITLANAYWDANSTGQTTAFGSTSNWTISGTATNVAAAPRTQSTYAGFDFTNTWVMIAGETRPMLRNEYSTVIATPSALQLMSLDLSASYTLGANINMTSALAAGGNGYYGGLWGASGFVPIGNSGSNFTGTFNGQGHTITGLSISRSGTNYVGLFGYTNGAVISNVTLSGGSLTGNDDVGALVGYMMGGFVTDATASATIAAVSTGESNAGGLVGANNGGSITTSSSSGSVTAAGYQAGGLVGYNLNGGTIFQSYATGTVTGTSASDGYIGGLVGANGYSGDGGTISQSYATGTVTGSAGPIGGFVGHNDGTITDSYATGRVIGLSGASNIGGFVGVNFPNGTIANAYSTGFVTGSSQVGGFAGYNNNSPSAITNAYWDTQTSGQSSGIFGGSGGITARTTAQLQGSLPAGFSYSIWSTGTNLYPYFSWQYSTTPVAVSGIAYSDAGTTALSGATVTGVAAGTAIGSAVTGDNGYYYILLAPGSSIASTGVLTYLDNGAIKGATFSDVAGTNGIQNASIYGSAVNVLTGQATLTATRSNYLSTLGSYSDTDLSFLSSNSFAPLTTTSGFGVYLNTSGSYVLNANLGSSGLLSLNSGGTFSVSGTATVSAAGALTIADAISWSNSASLTLSTTNSGNINLGGAVTGAAGTLIVNAGGTATTASAIDVGTFRLTGGSWNQIAASLPTFNATSFALGSGTTFLRATGGDGSVATPYEIADLYGLQGIASTSLLSQNFALVADINAVGTSNWNSGAGFVSIGSSGTSFTGSFDGRGHSITGLLVNQPTLSAGLFGTIGSSGSVSDLSVAGVVTGLNAGILAGANAGTVSGVTTSGTVNNMGAATYGDIGGLVGQNTGTISNSASSTSVSAGSVSGSNVGGLVGSNSSSGTISGSYASGSVTNAGAASGTAGGLAGSSAGAITNAFATGAVTSGYYSGGLVGRNNGGTVSNAYATGSVNGEYVGGLVGRSSGTIANTYATGSVSGNQYSGGLVGYNDTSGAISGSFWDMITSGNSIGVGGGPMSGIVGMTTAQMRNLSTFTGAGWSVDDAGGTASVWRIYEGYTAPLLRSFMTSLTVTGTSATKTYDGSAISSDTGTLTYSDAGYDTSLVNGTAIYTASSANVGTYSGSNLTLSGLYSGQQGYDITFISGSLTVNAKAITVTADAKSMVYGDSTPALTYQITSGSLVNGDSLTGALATTATATSNVGSYAITQNSLGNSNYAITYIGANVSVAAATLTVTAANGSMSFGARVPALGYTVTGWKNGQSDSLLSGVVVGTNATSSSPSGTGYITTASGGSLLFPASGNYVLNYVNGTFSVTGQVIPTLGASAGVLLDPSNVPAFPLHAPQTVDYRWSKTDDEKRSNQSANGSIMSVEHLSTSCTVQSTMSGPCSLN